MPELPEVETTLRGIKPFISKQKIVNMIVRQYQLRWPIPADIQTILTGQAVETIQRRGKYLLLTTTFGTVIIHLGMSGSLRILNYPTPPNKHDHLDIVFANQKCLRLTDPRRFGAFLWTSENPFSHPLLAKLGPEPFGSAFTGDYLWQQARKRKISIKSFLMSSNVVVGVGNIYATEALFAAKINPRKAAGKISLVNYKKLVQCIKEILAAAIAQGGTTLKDFVDSNGNKGYFKVHLKVYGRGGSACTRCKTVLKEIRQGQRATVYCPRCQN